MTYAELNSSLGWKYNFYVIHEKLIGFLFFLFSHILPPDSPIVHILSASSAGFMAATLTNPIWFIKTRMQLDSNTQNPMTIGSCIKQIYQKSGFWGFYKGISASYVGISETVIHFVIYEALKAKMVCN